MMFLISCYDFLFSRLMDSCKLSWFSDLKSFHKLRSQALRRCLKAQGLRGGSVPFTATEAGACDRFSAFPYLPVP